MTARIYENIRTILETTPGKTQKGLAERMGLNPAAVNRMLYGRRNIMAEEIPMIEDYLGVRLDLSAPAPPAASPFNIEYRQETPPHGPRRGFSDVPAQAAPRESNYVPVYGSAAGGLHKGLNLESAAVADWVARHPAQSGIAGAFAVYVFSDAMEPRYFPGELVYVHPGRPPEAGRDCIIEMQNGDAAIKRYLRQTEDKVRVAQFNPPEEQDIPKDAIRAVYAVVGRG
ncbi:MAG: helix-turn-helix transcriptional regulator [Alphaproteobacteria bacterium]|nr:helix-turn-helix domain-containing protein [Alphaproteobacteria bacterium]MDE2335944.1 helix-turn-helix transcriptional regulator [Alphaproteobacteria bacterium]